MVKSTTGLNKERTLESSRFPADGLLFHVPYITSTYSSYGLLEVGEQGGGGGSGGCGGGVRVPIPKFARSKLF